jgi:hypothetical protein
MTRLRSHLHSNDSGPPPQAKSGLPTPGVIEVPGRKPSEGGGGEELFLGKAILIVSILGLLWIALISFFISRMPPQ